MMGFLDSAGLSRFFAGLKDKFLMKEQTVNHLEMEEEGGVLDARQGKVLDEKKAETAVFFAAFTADGWTENEGVFVQTAVAEGLRETDYPLMDVDLSQTENVQAYLEQWGKIGRAVCADGVVTAMCYGGSHPVMDMNAVMRVVR